jgi:GNAT superfamily N-acetyltransferase
MAEYFLPDVKVLRALPCDFELKILQSKDFKDLYIDKWSNALCEDRKELDVLGVGAYHDGQLIGLAACSADCDTMWQIGVDVLPEYRKKGIASALTSRLAMEILERGKVPFYCCAWSNIKSARNAMKSGFRPAWVEMTVKPASFVEEMNK